MDLPVEEEEGDRDSREEHQGDDSEELGRQDISNKADSSHTIHSSLAGPHFPETQTSH